MRTIAMGRSIVQYERSGKDLYDFTVKDEFGRQLSVGQLRVATRGGPPLHEQLLGAARRALDEHEKLCHFPHGAVAQEMTKRREAEEFQGKLKEDPAIEAAYERGKADGMRKALKLVQECCADALRHL